MADDRRFWDEDAQTMPPERLREVQDAGVRDLVRRVLAVPVPLFRRKLADAGITSPDDVQGVEDLTRIPTTVKQELRDSEAEHPPFGDYRFCGTDACVRLGTSTGTTGAPTVVLWTRGDLELECDSAARMFWRNGFRPGMVATHAHPAYLYGGGPLLSGAIEHFGMLNVWVPPPDTDELAEKGVRLWARVRPDVSFVAFSLDRYREVADRDGLALELPAYRLGGEGGPGLPLMTAGIECYAYAAGPCDRGPGGHVHEDRVVVQAVDPATGADVPDGEWGNLVVTTIGRDNALLRYDLEEACAIARDPCACGETTIRAFWGGRFKDLLECQGKRFFVHELEASLRAIPEIARPALAFHVVRPSGDAPLRIRVETATRTTDVADRVRVAIGNTLGVAADVEVVDRGTLPRSGYKAEHVVDR
ncbi:MAG: phenylacetate--CoA ligase family protein [Actinomycetota bacterium]